MRAWDYGPEGKTTGDVKYSGNCWVRSYTIVSRVGDVVKARVELQVDGVTRGFRASRLSSSMAQFPDTEIRLPASAKRLVWFVDHWSPASARPRGLTEIELPHGRYLYVLPLDRGPVAYEDYTFVRESPPGRVRKAR
mgnify:CR=1 FL=1